MDYLFSQHDLSFLDDVIPEKDKKKKEDEKKKKKKKGSLDSDNDDVRGFLKFRSKIPKLVKQMWKLYFLNPSVWWMSEFSECLLLYFSPLFALYFLSLFLKNIFWNLL